MIHAPKVDWWVPVLLGGGSLGVTAMGASFLVAGLSEGPPMPVQNIIAAAVDGAVALLLGLNLWACYRVIRYEVTPSELKIICTPFRKTVPLATIVDVSPTHNPIKAPAPSLDRLCITYRTNPQTLKYAYISPKDKVAFLRDLSTAAPHLRPAEGNPLRLVAEAPAATSTGR